MSESSRSQAIDFMENEKQFHLGFLPTEQSSPLTRDLDKRFSESTTDGVRCLQRVDQNVLEMAQKVLKSPEYSLLVNTGKEIIAKGGKIVFSGCGATGRLSILLECMWRKACADFPAGAAYADQVKSIMTGGDYALVRSVEFFEDYQEFGRQQVREMEMSSQDMLVAITEGGETSSVLGTVDEALKRNCKVFLLFNNPADLLAEHLERSRKAITDPGVCVLDLHCGPMALAGSTRMQATTSEQLIAGSALEIIFCDLINTPHPDYGKEFELLLKELNSSASAIANYIDFESSVYSAKGKITYFADDYLLDIFTDTTERSPTFMLPPFRKKDDSVSPMPWAFVKDPLCSTAEVWNKGMKRPLRCLAWTPEDYKRMGAPERIVANPPAICKEELLKFEVGNESVAERCASKEDAAVLVTVCDQGNMTALQSGFANITSAFTCRKHLAVGGNAEKADFYVAVSAPESPLQIMRHMAIKLVLNTASTGIMVVLGRVTGNWMSYVDVTNKKLMDRGIRLICEIGHLSYEESAFRIFETVETLNATHSASEEKPSAVQLVLASLKNN